MKTLRGRVCGALLVFFSGASFAQDDFISDEFSTVISDSEDCSSDESGYYGDDEYASYPGHPGGGHGRPGFPGGRPGFPGGRPGSYPYPYPTHPSYPRPGDGRGNGFECVARSRAGRHVFRGEGFSRFMAERNALRNCRLSSPYAHSCYIAYCSSTGGRGGHW